MKKSITIISIINMSLINMSKFSITGVRKLVIQTTVIDMSDNWFVINNHIKLIHHVIQRLQSNGLNIYGWYGSDFNNFHNSFFRWSIMPDKSITNTTIIEINIRSITIPLFYF